jgi:signal transduction histidine kinase
MTRAHDSAGPPDGIPGGPGAARHAGYALYGLADVLALFLPIALGMAGARVSLATDVLALLAAMSVIVLAGGLVPALAWAAVAAVLLFFARGARHSSLTATGIGAAAIPILLTAVALGVSVLGFHAARRSRRAARTAAETARRVAEADRMRAALLAAVGHDLRSPLAAAKAAVGGLRCAGVPLSVSDRGELLAAADESLDQLARLAVGLLDMSRLQAGKLPVFPRPAVLADIITRAVGDAGPRPVAVCVAAGLPEVMVDPACRTRRPEGGAPDCRHGPLMLFLRIYFHGLSSAASGAAGQHPWPMARLVPRPQVLSAQAAWVDNSGQRVSACSGPAPRIGRHYGAAPAIPG